MHELYSWPWVEGQSAQTIEVWNSAAGHPIPGGSIYTEAEQQIREAAYDQALASVEQEMKRPPATSSGRAQARDRIIAAFARFSAAALDLDEPAVQLLTHDFLPVGTGLAQWARRFDPDLPMAGIIQACRNAWTACGMQPLLGHAVQLTPSILAYSLLYPYSDNYLDGEDAPTAAKLRFCLRFRDRLRGHAPVAENARESALWNLVELIEIQYPRAPFPDVFACLLAIHRAQEESIAQGKDRGTAAQTGHEDEARILRMSCAKGGTSVLADACLAHGSLTPDESRFAFEWGVLLQLGDDLQDLQDDMRRRSVTIFSQAASAGIPLDALAAQLLNYGEAVAARMDRLPHGDPVLKALLRMSWRSLIIRAVADSHRFFSSEFLEQAERCSPFRFEFLRSRNERLTSHQGLYANLFHAFLESSEASSPGLLASSLSTARDQLPRPLTGPLHTRTIALP